MSEEDRSDLVVPKDRLQGEREKVRHEARPASSEPLPLNGLAARHALEPSLPSHRDEEALRLPLKEDADTRSPEHIRLMFRRAFMRPKLTFEELEPYRVRVAWRWVREVATLKNIVGYDQLLSDALLMRGQDPWHDPEVGEVRFDTPWMKLRADVVEMVNPPNGLSLMPSRVPDSCIDDDGHLKSDYNPRHDEGLVRWLQAFDRVSTYLGIPRGSEHNPDEGRFGLYGMLNHDTLRLCFPSVVKILTWEDMLVRETWNNLISEGQRGTERTIRSLYGLHDMEVSRLIKMARAYGEKEYSTDMEGDRALLCARLEDLALRCRGAVPDIRAELQAYKALAIIKGVTRSEADDFVKEVSAVIGRVANERKTLDVSATVRRLPPGA